MAMLCASIDRGKVAEVDAWSAKLGRPYRFQRLIDQIDFDPDELMLHVDRILDAHDALAEALPALDAATETSGTWTGAAAAPMQENAECQRSFWGHVLDFLLWLAENLVQLLDYLVDALRIVVAWITFVLGALATIIAAVIFIAAIIGGGPIGVAFDAVAAVGWLGTMGTIAALGAVVSLILWALGKLFDWLEVVIRDARSKICGKGLPSLPDWDPTGWEPPGWPV